MKNTVLTGNAPRISVSRTFRYSFVFSVLNGLRAYPKGGQSLLLVSTAVSKFLISKAVNQFFGFILLVFKLCRNYSVGCKVRLTRCFR